MVGDKGRRSTEGLLSFRAGYDRKSDPPQGRGGHQVPVTKVPETPTENVGREKTSVFDLFNQFVPFPLFMCACVFF